MTLKLAGCVTRAASARVHPDGRFYKQLFHKQHDKGTLETGTRAAFIGPREQTLDASARTQAFNNDITGASL